MFVEMAEIELTMARMIVQSSHHTFLVIHSLTEQRNITTISVTVTTTHRAMIKAGPLLTSPSGGASVELIVRNLLSSFSLGIAVFYASILWISDNQAHNQESGALFIP